MQIEQVEENDLRCVLALQKACFTEVARQMNQFDLPPLQQTFEDIYHEYQKGIFLKYLSDSGQIIGSVRGYADENNICHLGKLIVHPDFQNQGIGKKLMCEIEKYFPACIKFSLFTGEETPNTLHLYTRLGYHTVCKKKLDGICMLFMEKENAKVNKLP